MKLYAVSYKGTLSNNEWSIINIWKTKENAIETMERYRSNWSKQDLDIPEYTITEIDTDVEDDCIYDYELI